MAVGLVVAGGFSTRFGVADKALAEVGGEPMLRRAVRALAPLVDAVVVDCREDQLHPFRRALAPLSTRVRFAVDPTPDAGPVAGLANGLEVASGTGPHSEALVLSCDRPGVTAAVLEHLRERRWGADVAAAVPTIAGRLQPLCGSYRARALRDACLAVRANGSRRLTRVPERLCHLAIPAADLPHDAAALRSLDTRVEAAVHDERLGSVAVRDDPAGPAVAERTAVPARNRERP